MIVKRNEYLEKNIDNLTSLYYQLLNERTILGVANQVLENKLSRSIEKIKFLEDQLNSQIDNMRMPDERSLADEIARLNNSRASRSSQISGNIRKPLRGGGNKNTVL